MMVFTSAVRSTMWLNVSRSAVGRAPVNLDIATPILLKPVGPGISAAYGSQTQAVPPNDQPRTGPTNRHATLQNFAVSRSFRRFQRLTTWQSPSSTHVAPERTSVVQDTCIALWRNS